MPTHNIKLCFYIECLPYSRIQFQCCFVGRCVNIVVNGLSFCLSCICSHTQAEHYRTDWAMKNNVPVSIYWRTLIYSFSSKIQSMILSFLPFPLWVTQFAFPLSYWTRRQEMIISSIILSVLVCEIYKDISFQRYLISLHFEFKVACAVLQQGK